ncbi:COG3650 family protein [Pseudoponticoccus marisrubri]|uniref:SH3b domain-containing protein n=1 Tax=Pseudoponticoccus marisrubri TaxID=1685382 RepID=A0A0W7WJA3_9RHOB|nr:SH3 domain-containing protein [Pseudoponticoccus marisrubri]KUF10669.1 hypothetical protein AVJ23_12420 [Pseudoponticoccus marisrubri]
MILAGAVAAQNLPALYDVTDVASDDILNVRNRPSASSTVIGTLAFDARGVEVVETQDNWGRVNVDGVSGWASMRFLSRQPDSDLPHALRFDCFGTEPFWSLEVTQGNSAIFSTPEGRSKAFRIGNVTTASGRPFPHAVLGTAPGENIALVVGREICSDGMSDNLFGHDGTVVLSGYDMQVYSGCCSVQAD